MKKYTPVVARIVGMMQRNADLTLNRRLQITSVTRQTTHARSYAWLGRHEESEQAWNAMMKTKGDLIEVIGGTTKLGNVDYQLTERGKTVNLDRKGQEQAANWAPKPYISKWSGRKVFLLPTSLNIVMVIENEDDDRRWRDAGGMKEPDPWLQLPGPNPMDHPTTKHWFDARRKERDAQPEKPGDIVTFAGAVNRFKWDYTLRRTWEGFLSVDDGDVLGFIKSAEFGWKMYEPHSATDIESVIEDLCIDIASGRLESGLFGGEHINIRSAGSSLGRARKSANRTWKSDKKLYYFKVEMEIDPHETSDWVYRFISFDGDKDLEPDPGFFTKD